MFGKVGKEGENAQPTPKRRGSASRGGVKNEHTRPVFSRVFFRHFYTQKNIFSFLVKSCKQILGAENGQICLLLPLENVHFENASLVRKKSGWDLLAIMIHTQLDTDYSKEVQH